jgi:gas vesicle protein
MRRTLSFLTGMITGAVVGAVVTLLLTPASGEDFKQQIQDWTTQTRENIQQAAVTRRAELEAQLATLRAPKQ